MKAWQLLVLGILLGLIAAGLILLVASPPIGSPIQLNPPPTASLIAVHVAGAVNHPGIFLLVPGSRVNDAVQAAGGLSPEADAAAINLAATLQDGMKVVIYAQGELDRPPVTSLVDETDPLPAPQYPVNLNLATLAELESLPGIGTTRAQAIIAYREEHGPFTTLDELQQVEGIGPGIFESVLDLITLDIGP